MLDLGTLGGTHSEAFALNDAGHVVGFAKTVTGEDRAFRTGPNSAINPLTDNLGLLSGATASYAYAINGAGQVAGDSTILRGDRAYRYSGLTMSPLGTLGGNWSYAFGINGLGHVVGGSSISNSLTTPTQAFLHNGSQMYNLGTFGFPPYEQNSYAYAINSAGQIAGYSSAANWEEHAFVWTPTTPNGTTGTMVDIGGLGGGYSYAYAINDAGQVVGGSTTTGELSYHAFLRSGGTNIDLQTLGGTFSEAYGINDAGHVVGASDELNGQVHAFIYADGTMLDLNNLIPDAGGWLLESARAINSGGQIAGFGMSPGGETRAFLLTPQLTWKVDAGGDWLDSSNWFLGMIPDGIGAAAYFAQAITESRAVALNANVTLGTINFSNTNSYVFSGTGMLTIDTAAGNGAINVAAGSHTIGVPVAANTHLAVTVTPADAALTISGGISGIGLTKFGAGTLTVGGAQNWWVGATLTSQGGLLRLNSDAGVAAANASVHAAGGDVEFDSSQQLLALTVDAGRTATLAPDGQRVVRAENLFISGRVDLTDNALVTAEPLGSWDGSAYTGVTGWIAAGRNGGAWDGNGIITSTSDALAGIKSLGVASAAQTGYIPIFRGIGVWPDDVIVMYTWGGDADLDGDLDGDDYFRLDSNVAQSGTVFGYANGDFNYDGALNGDDYFIIDSNIARAQTPLDFPTGAGTRGMVTVPEPTAAAGLLAFLSSLAARRRRA